MRGIDIWKCIKSICSFFLQFYTQLITLIEFMVKRPLNDRNERAIIRWEWP